MKKLIELCSVLVIVLSMVGCGDNNNDSIPSKELTVSYCQSKGEDYAAEQLQAYKNKQLRDAWGEPDGSLFGFWGDIWETDSTCRLIVYYDADGTVEHVTLTCEDDNGRSRPVSAYISEDVAQIEITHFSAGIESKWTAEGEEVGRIREWVKGLRYEILAVEDGQTPGDSDGNEVYDFVLTEGDYPGFTYIINGNSYYLLIEGYWYSVTNPSAPPCGAPQTK